MAKFIERFNEVSMWVVTEVLQLGGKSQRKILEKMIDVAVKCERLGNFNMMWAVVSGLNNSSVSR